MSKTKLIIRMCPEYRNQDGDTFRMDVFEKCQKNLETCLRRIEL